MLKRYGATCYFLETPSDMLKNGATFLCYMLFN